MAVLAAGLDQPIYPPGNIELAPRIIQKQGLLISTYPLKTKLYAKFLAARDEWQSGLSDGVIALETRPNSGTNITLAYAKKQTRPIMIVNENISIVDLERFQKKMLSNL